jgi:hypothetical protein
MKKTAKVEVTYEVPSGARETVTLSRSDQKKYEAILKLNGCKVLAVVH